MVVKAFFRIFILLVLSTTSFSIGLNAQQLKLGENPTQIDKSAILELDSRNQGILLTRIKDTALINSLSPPDGTIIYFTDSNKVTQMNFGPNAGVYERTNGVWQKLRNGAANGYWSLTGNANTDPAKHFLGTTDKTPLVFKTNKEKVGYFNPNNHSVSLGNSANASADYSIAMGYGAAVTQVAGIAIGHNSKSDFQSIAIGKDSKAVSSAYGNATAMGAQTEAMAENATALGSNAKATGQNALALGYKANATGENSVAAGANATASEANTFILGDESIKVGIRTSSPQYVLDVSGTGHFRDELTLDKELNVDNGIGTAGQVLSSQGAGHAPQWINLPSGGGSSGGSGWSLSGNNVSSGDFLGTTNYNPLIFKVNGTQVGYLGADGESTITFGANALASYQSISIGKGATASANNSVLIGFGTTSNSFQSIAIGDGAKTNGNNNNTIAIGSGTSASGYQSTALGNGAVASAQNATAIGNGAAANQDNTLILGNGNIKVGIRKSNPAYSLDVSGDINASGAVRANGVALSSDIRYKKDLHQLKNALISIDSLHTYTYFFQTGKFKEKNFPKSKQIGMIAQEVEKVFLELVSTDEDGYKSLNYAQFSAVLLEAVKEQQTEIKELKKRHQKEVGMLNEKLEDLSKRIDVLEN